MNMHRPTDRLAHGVLVHQQLCERIARIYGEDADSQVVIDTAEGETTLDGTIVYALLEANARKAEGEGLDAVIDAIKERKARHLKAYADIRAAVIQAMNDSGMKSIKHKAMTVSIRDGKPALRITGDPPNSYCQQAIKWVPDKDKIMAAIESGDTLEFAHMSNPEPVLTARLK